MGSLPMPKCWPNLNHELLVETDECRNAPTSVTKPKYSFCFQNLNLEEKGEEEEEEEEEGGGWPPFFLFLFFLLYSHVHVLFHHLLNWPLIYWITFRGHLCPPLSHPIWITTYNKNKIAIIGEIGPLVFIMSVQFIHNICVGIILSLFF